MPHERASDERDSGLHDEDWRRHNRDEIGRGFRTARVFAGAALVAGAAAWRARGSLRLAFDAVTAVLAYGAASTAVLTGLLDRLLRRVGAIADD